MDNTVVICRDNDPVKNLEGYCKKYGIIYVANEREYGFAHNNNANFRLYQETLDPQPDDRFLVLNPDVLLKPSSLKAMLLESEKKPDSIIAADLYLDKEYIFQDDNIRFYPRFSDFIRTYIFNHRVTMLNKKKDHFDPDRVWASAACILLTSDWYQRLGGFDERFYMYCEDIDLCRRARRQGVSITLCKRAKGVHFRRRDSKRFLTKYFFWHVRSVLRYSLTGVRDKPVLTSVMSEPKISRG